MNVYEMTRKGWAQVRDPQQALPWTAQLALMLVNCDKPLFVLREQWSALGAPANVESILRRRGFIELVPLDRAEVMDDFADSKAADDTRRLKEAREFMSLSIRGIRALLLRFKLQRCSSCAGLRALLPRYAHVVRDLIGDDHADVLITEVCNMFPAEPRRASRLCVESPSQRDAAGYAAHVRQGSRLRFSTT